MSAYVVNREIIGNIIAGALIRGVTYQHNGQTYRLDINDVSAGVRVGQMLWDANIASVLYRYPQDTIATMPGPGETDYTFTATDIREDHTVRGTSWTAAADEHPLAIAIRCLNYQSCERDDWPNSEPKAFLDALAAQLPDELRAMQAKARLEYRRAAAQADAERTAAIAAGRAWLDTHTPSGAVACIIAELHNNDSDPQSDYHNHTTAARVVLAWSFHKRNNFAEMRRAAAACGLPELEHLGPGCDEWNVMRNAGPDDTRTWLGRLEWDGADTWTTEPAARAALQAAQADDDAKRRAVPFVPFCPILPFGAELTRESIEHRENYSMGAGYYLKAGHSHATG